MNLINDEKKEEKENLGSFLVIGEKKEMRFSVIVPCLNEARHLPVFLDSLTRQTFTNFELVVVDGRSEDDSLDIVKSYMDQLKIIIVIDGTRNIGYIRNLGALYSNGDILFHGSSDTYLEPYLLEKLDRLYSDPDLVSVAGRTFPLGTSIIAHVGYQLFDLLRYAFTWLPAPFKKYRPSGNFSSYQRKAFQSVKGFPEVTVNEDGLLGQRMDEYIKRYDKRVLFDLNLYVGHHVKKFERMGGIQAILFYLYTLGNLFPLLKPFLDPIEIRAGLVFKGELSIKESVFSRLWKWL